MKRKRSPIWKISKEEFQKLCDNSTNYADILRYFSLKHYGNLRTIHERIKEDSISMTKFHDNKKNLKLERVARPLESVLIENSDYDRYSLKKRILKLKLIEYICKSCNMSPIWNNKPLVLQIEHINGIPNDNRLENLCFLCPNCHSQTETFTNKRRN